MVARTDLASRQVPPAGASRRERDPGHSQGPTDSASLPGLSQRSLDIRKFLLFVLLLVSIGLGSVTGAAAGTLTTHRGLAVYGPSPAVWVYPTAGLIQDDRGSAFSRQTEASRDRRIEAGRRQGSLEIMLFWLILLALLAPYLLGKARSSGPIDRQLALLASLPNIVNLIDLLVSNSAGDWGRLKHPRIHELVAEHGSQFHDLFNASILVSLLFYLFLMTYSVKKRSSVHPVIVVHAALWGLYIVFQNVIMGLVLGELGKLN